MQALHDQEQFAAGSSQLLMALAEQLKLPYLQIARRAELTRSSHEVDPEEQLKQIELTADTALQLIDNYIFGMQLSSGQLSLVLEPVSIGSVLDEAAHRLAAYAQQYHIELELKLTGRFVPVMAHKPAFVSALCCLGQVLIEAKSQQADGKQVVTLAAHRTNRGDITAGIFGGSEAVTTDMFRRARQLYGRVRQPMFSVTSSSGAGIFVADSIFSAMATKLRVAHHGNLAGLAASFQPSRQMTLI